MNTNLPKKNISTPLKLVISIALLCTICLLVFEYEINWRPDPVSPPPTDLGADPVFDTLLFEVDSIWRFLMRQDNKLVLTDIFGNDKGVILDILVASENSESELLRRESISPNNTLLAANYFNERDDENGIVAKMMIVDLVSGYTRDVPISLDGFSVDWSYPAFWLSNDSILVKMHRYIGEDAYSEESVFLQYDLRDYSLSRDMWFGPCSMSIEMDHETHVLLLASDCEPTNDLSVWAIDSSGKRLASADEKLLFEEYHRDRYRPLDMYDHPTDEFPSIRIESVAGGIDGFGRFYNDNWYREYLYLGEKLVRVSDSIIGWDPLWQADIPLFIWTESDQTYFTDSQGHYRIMYDGVYAMRIPISVDFE